MPPELCLTRCCAAGRPRGGSGSGLLLAALCIAPVLRAQSRALDPRASESEFEKGKERLEAGDWAAACRHFQTSFDLDRSVSALVKIARCREHEGRLASALAEYERALDLNRVLRQSEEHARALDALIRKEAETLRPRVPSLRATFSPLVEGAEIVVDDQKLPSSAIGAPWPVDPGQHQLVIRAPGYRTERMTQQIGEGQTVEVRVLLVREAHPAGGVAPSPSAHRSQTPHVPPSAARHDDRGSAGRWQRPLSFVAGGLGVATLGAAAYFGIKTQLLVGEAEDHRFPGTHEYDRTGMDRLDHAESAQTTGLVLAGVGAALLGTGAALYFTVPSEGSGTALHSCRFRLAVAPTGATLQSTW